MACEQPCCCSTTHIVRRWKRWFVFSLDRMVASGAFISDEGFFNWRQVGISPKTALVSTHQASVKCPTMPYCCVSCASQLRGCWLSSVPFYPLRGSYHLRPLQ
ncbi:unnamed protein product [Ectocarpus sp. 13 AM-2016]